MMDEINKLLKQHATWLKNKKGKKIDFSSISFRNIKKYNMNLREASLRCMDFNEGNFAGSNFKNANLLYAEFYHTNLSSTNFQNANLQNADLRFANLQQANLEGVNLQEANLCGANLEYTNLQDANLYNANLSHASFFSSYCKNINLHNAMLTHTNFQKANLSGSKGLISQVDYISSNFEKNDEGIVVYKIFKAPYSPPKHWKIETGSILTEINSFDRTVNCTHGINVATKEQATIISDRLNQLNVKRKIWKALIRWEWLSGICVPYHTEGQIRCEKIELLNIIN